MGSDRYNFRMWKKCLVLARVLLLTAYTGQAQRAAVQEANDILWCAQLILLIAWSDAADEAGPAGHPVGTRLCVGAGRLTVMTKISNGQCYNGNMNSMYPGRVEGGGGHGWTGTCGNACKNSPGCAAFTRFADWRGCMFSDSNLASGGCDYRPYSGGRCLCNSPNSACDSWVLSPNTCPCCTAAWSAGEPESLGVGFAACCNRT